MKRKNQKLNRKTSRKEKLLQKLGYITESCAYVKFNDNQEWPIDYVRIDDSIYSNRDKMADNIINYSRNIQRAIELVRPCENISDLGKHINPHIIKYHPSWIYLRETFGFTSPAEGEILGTSDASDDTFMNFYQNNFLALGIDVPYDSDIQKDKIMSYDEFNENFSEELLEKCVAAGADNHPDFLAFQLAARVKKDIDDYNQKINDGVNPKDISFGFKSVGYRLGDDGFPLITIGSNKKKTSYDFRDVNSYKAFCEKMAAKNPKSDLGKTIKKMRGNRR